MKNTSLSAEEIVLALQQREAGEPVEQIEPVGPIAPEHSPVHTRIDGGGMRRGVLFGIGIEDVHSLTKLQGSDMERQR